MIVLCLLGFGFQFRGLWTIQMDKNYNNMLNMAIAETSGEYVLSDLNWLPLNAAPIYDEKAWFVAQTPQSVTAWVAHAAEQQIPRFSIVTHHDTALAETVTLILNEHNFDIMSIDTIREYTHIYHVTASDVGEQPTANPYYLMQCDP
jgi:hypothetical protein